MRVDRGKDESVILCAAAASLKPQRDVSHIGKSEFFASEGFCAVSLFKSVLHIL
jgi:hypothetical protein